MSILKTLTVNGTTYSVTPVVPACDVTLLASAWVGDGDAYSQVVEIPEVTAHTKVDLQPTAEQLAEFHHKVLAFVAENEGGTITVYAIGDKPTDDHTIQVTKTEVESTGMIRGNTVGTTMPRPDWDQTDPTKADYIRNKPDLSLYDEKFSTIEEQLEAITPVFDLDALGMADIPISGGQALLETDTTEICAALDGGPVTLVIPFDVDGSTILANITMAGASTNGQYQCIAIVNYTEPAMLQVNMTATAILVMLSAMESGASSWNDLTDKPFGEESGMVALFEEQTIDDFALDSSFNMYGSGMRAVFELVEGQSYQVLWDGSVYNCTAFTFDLGTFAGIALGNEGAMTGTTTEIVEPFLIAFVQTSNFNSFFAMDGSTEASHKVGVYQEGIVIKTLDAKYLPDDHINSLIDAKLGVIENGTY